MTASVFTIGHSTLTCDAFVSLLKRHAIELLVDVRSSPYSRWQPQFGQDALPHELGRRGIEYLFLGTQLGGRPRDRSCYVDGRVRYSVVAETQSFRAGIVRVVEESSRRRVALMCAEKEPLECHRTLLVAKALEFAGMEIFHIHSDGTAERHEDAMMRLLQLMKMPRETLFESTSELIDQACARQAQAIAFREDTAAASV